MVIALFLSSLKPFAFGYFDNLFNEAYPNNIGNHDTKRLFLCSLRSCWSNVKCSGSSTLLTWLCAVIIIKHTLSRHLFSSSKNMTKILMSCYSRVRSLFFRCLILCYQCRLVYISVSSQSKLSITTVLKS